MSTGAVLLVLGVLVAAYVWVFQRGRRPAGSGASRRSAFRVRLDRPDGGAPEIVRVMPVDATFVAMLRGPDRPDYLLFRLDQPVEWKQADRRLVVLATQMRGARLGRGARGMRVGIAIVHDESVEASSALDLSKVDFVVIAEATDIT